MTPCGCRVEFDTKTWMPPSLRVTYGVEHPFVIAYCPLHAAAGELLAALKATDVHGCMAQPWRNERQALIARAEGKC